MASANRPILFAVAVCFLVGLSNAVPIVHQKPPRDFDLLEALFGDLEQLSSMLPSPEEAREIGREAAQAFMNKHGTSRGKNLNPVFLMPGFMSSAIMAEYRKTSVPNIRCPRQMSYHQLWINSSNLNPVTHPAECMFDTISTTFDARTGSYSYKSGVSVSPKDLGGLSGIEYLDTNNKLPMYAPIISALEEIGYTRNLNIRGFPYEFPFPGTQHEKSGYYGRMASLIEEAYAQNGRSKVVLIGHSMGTLMTYYFLLNQPQSWKDTYIKGHISLTPLYIGAPFSIRLLVSGVSPRAELQALTRDITRGWGSVHWFLPAPRYNNIDFVTNPNRSYNSTQFEDLFRDLGIPDVSTSQQNSQALTGRLAPAGAPVHCFVAVGAPTPLQYSYNSTSMTGTPTVKYVDGDGLVTAESARSCSLLNPASIQEYETNHLFIMFLKQPIQDMLDIITAP